MIGHTAMMQNLFKEGKLKPLSDQRVPSVNQFYLLTKSAVPLSDAAQTFVDWVLAQAKTDA